MTKFNKTWSLFNNQSKLLLQVRQGASIVHQDNLLDMLRKLKEKNPTSIRSFGERFKTEYIVRRRVDHASLWKMIMTEVGGSDSGVTPTFCLSLHLKDNLDGELGCLLTMLPAYQADFC